MVDAERLIFVDEVGDNTSQKDDGNVGGEKFVVPKNGKATMKSSVKDNHFTVLGFTDGLGRPLMCAVIIAAMKLSAVDITGFNPLAEGGEVVMNEETMGGMDKLFPCGPVCELNGKNVSTYVSCTENGSITSELLADMLQKIDDSGVYAPDKEKVLLMDGHNSRFQLPFVEYTVETNPTWKPIFGVPYGTHIWQVGDSSEQNGTYKMQLKREKHRYICRKINEGYENGLVRSDIVP